MKASNIWCAAMLGLGGCMTTAGSGRLATDAVLVTNPFDTVANRPGVLLTARLAGSLTFDGKCLVVKTPGGPVVPLWPEGTRIVDRDGRHIVTLPDNRGSVTIGGRAALSGSAFSASDKARLPPTALETCPPDYFAVSTAN